MNQHLDQIHIRDLSLRTIIGLNPDERVNKQDILISLTLFHDITAAEASDDIDDVVDYRSVTKRIVQHVEASSYNLVEALALSIARIVLTEFPVQRVRVSLDKPGAVRFTRSVGVEIERARDGML